MINMILNGLNDAGQGAISDLVHTLAAISAALAVAVAYGAGIFAVFLGWRLALADDEQKRKNVKGQIVWSILALVVITGIVGIWHAISAFLTGGYTALPGEGGELRTESPFIVIADYLSGGAVRWIMITMLGIIAGMGGLLAIYLGVKLATADNEQTRSNAKAQMIYAILAVVIVAGLISIFSIQSIWQGIIDSAMPPAEPSYP